MDWDSLMYLWAVHATLLLLFLEISLLLCHTIYACFSKNWSLQRTMISEQLLQDVALYRNMDLNSQMWLLAIPKAFSDSLRRTTLHFTNLKTCDISGMLEYIAINHSFSCEGAVVSACSDNVDTLHCNMTRDDSN